MNFGNKKGQAAMEFLMTYGWAILIAIIAIAALIAFGVLNPPLQEACGTDGVLVQGVSCVNVIAHGTGTKTLAITITNNLAEPLTMSQPIYFNATTGGAAGGCTFASGATIASGGTATLTSMDNCITGAAGGNVKGDFSFNYSTDGGVTNYPASGLKIAKKISSN